MIAPATWLARWDPEMPGVPAFDLWNLTQDIPGHPAGSTVSTGTLESAGFRVPGERERLAEVRDRMSAEIKRRMNER